MSSATPARFSAPRSWPGPTTSPTPTAAAQVPAHRPTNRLRTDAGATGRVGPPDPSWVDPGVAMLAAPIDCDRPGVMRMAANERELDPTDRGHRLMHDLIHAVEYRLRITTAWNGVLYQAPAPTRLARGGRPLNRDTPPPDHWGPR